MNTGEKLEVIADAVYEKGKEDTIKTLWDAITNKGKKTVGTRMFNECDFTEIQELPYVWKCTSGNMSQMFYNYQGKKTMPRRWAQPRCSVRNMEILFALLI